MIWDLNLRQVHFLCRDQGQVICLISNKIQIPRKVLRTNTQKCFINAQRLLLKQMEEIIISLIYLQQVQIVFQLKVVLRWHLEVTLLKVMLINFWVQVSIIIPNQSEMIHKQI